jgi:glycosyltransferase involved in cell wall biosynthesis
MTKVSVIIPARNEEEHIGECLDSLMEQTRKPFEIIVITNNSTDRTREIVDGYKNKGVKQIVFNGRSSAAIARNRGAKIAKGDILYFLDADITCSQTLIKEIYEVFSDTAVMHAMTPQVKAHVSTFIQRCYKAKSSYIHQRQVKEKNDIRGVNIIRKELFEKIGHYPEDIFYFEDRVWWDKVKEYKQGIIKSTVYHNDPADLREFIRQSKYIGKGVSTYKLRKLLEDNPSLAIATIAFSVLFVSILIISLIISDLVKLIWFIALILISSIIAYGLIRWVVYSIYSKMPIESFAWIFMLIPIRFFYIGLEYLKNKLGNLG